MKARTASQRLHDAAAPVWAQYLTHPFITGIGSGTLDIEKFRFYMIQDYLYLYDYAKVFALGVVRSRTPELMRIFSGNVDAILNGEMNVHRAYMARLGITEAQAEAAEPSLDNTSYTSYMLSVAANGTPVEIVAAILACSWSYAEIGQALRKIPGADSHPFYGEWVRSYAGAEYAATNDALIALLDALAADASEAQLRYLEEIFVACSRHELRFWDMAWAVPACHACQPT